MFTNYKQEYGEEVLVQLDPEVVEFMLDSDREMRNLEERERYHRKCSIDALVYENREIAADTMTPEEIVIYDEEKREFYESLSFLTVTQFRRMLMKLGGMSFRYQNRRLVWLCYTTKRQGPKGCPAKQIPDEILRSVCCEVLGIDEFDEDLFDSRIDSITADTDGKGGMLTFRMTDGEVIVKRWEKPLRSRSWTPEMKERARQNAKKGGADNGSK